MRAPARIKKGTAKRGKESQPVKIFCGTMTRGMFPFTRRPNDRGQPHAECNGDIDRNKTDKGKTEKETHL